MRNKLCLLCIVCLGTSVALAQAPAREAGAVWYANQARAVTPALVSPVELSDVPVATARAEGDPYIEMPFTPGPPDKDRKSGSECPTGYLCGQNYDSGEGNPYYYSDLTFCNPAAPTQCGRVSAEDFPPPGEAALTTPIGVVSFRGAYIGAASKPHVFDIKFYAFDPADPNRPLISSPTCSYTNVVPFQATFVRTINWSGGGTGDEYNYTVVLPTACTIGSGYFSIAGMDASVPNCYWLWAPSDSTQGNSRTSRWWVSPFAWAALADSPEDRQYCFAENKPGACCNDMTALCDPNSNEFGCLAVNGRFAASPATCASINPACGSALGACCKDDGTCTQTTYGACVGEGACCVGAVCTVYSEAACVARGGTYKGNGVSCTPSPCVIPYCPGDTNCDYTISYADINPFVRAITSESLWKTTFPGSTPPSGCTYLGVCDINGSTTVDYGDINPFVVRLQTPGPCPTRGSGPDKAQGNVWLGPNTLCTSCCTVVVDPGAPKENEPNDCGTDNYNAGCNSSPTTFTNLALNTWTYGESGTFGGNTRDTDWYLISLTGTANHTLTIQYQAEFDVLVELAKPGDCDANLPSGYGALSDVEGAACADPNTTQIVSRCLPSGNYWIIVAPAEFDGVPCGADYKIIVNDVTGCTFCDIPQPTTGNVHIELEACGADTNGGCSTDPNIPHAFEDLGTDPNNLQVFGHLYAKYPYRDLDWYSWKISGPSRIKWTVYSELPVRASIEFQQYVIGSVTEYIPPVCGGTNYYWTATLFTACTLGTSNNDLYYPDPNDPNIPFYMFITPENDAGGIFDGYPCGTYGTNENEYVLTITTALATCTDVCTWISPTTPEGEPVCSTGYTDIFNFGCDKATPDPNKMLTLIDGEGVCAQGGIFTKGTGTRPDYDWWKFTIPAGDNAQLYIETAGEFNYNVEMYKSADGTCGTIVKQESYTFQPCTELQPITSFCYTPGTYWFRVYAVGTNATCGKTYVLRVTMTNVGCVPCNVPVPPASPSGCINENETCGTYTNNLCDPNTGGFDLITCGQCYYGNTWADAGGNDDDFYKLTLTTAQYLQWTADADFPAVIWLFDSTLTCSALSGDAEMAGPCNQVTHKILDGSSQQLLLDPGDYYIMVQPGTISGNLVTTITENYPCNAGRNEYWVYVQCSSNPFP